MESLSDRHTEHSGDHELAGKLPVKLFDIHTQERLVIELDTARLGDVETQDKINHFFRDHRQNRECLMDTKLIDQLHNLQKWNSLVIDSAFSLPINLIITQTLKLLLITPIRVTSSAHMQNPPVGYEQTR